MGFLDSIGTLLGGFHDLQMADKYGQDWRAQKDASDFALQQKQAEEARAVRDEQVKYEQQVAQGLANASVGGQTDLESLIPTDVSAARRKFLLAQAPGLAAQAKSNLAQQKLASDLMLRQLLGEQRTQQIAQTGEQQQALARVKADLEAG